MSQHSEPAAQPGRTIAASLSIESTRRQVAQAVASIRRGRERSTTVVAVVAVGSLFATSVVVGIGVAGADADLADVGAWLPSANGSMVHVNGLSGDITGRVRLPGAPGSNYQVSEDGDTVLVMDESTGQVTRIDPAQLTAPLSVDLGDAGMQLVTGGERAWLVESGTAPGATTAVVRPIDPGTLAPLGPPIALGAKPIGRAQADAKGTLWIPIPSKGEVIPVRGAVLGTPIKVSEPNSPIMLALVADRAVVVDAAAGAAKILTDTGVQTTITLPSDLFKGGLDKAVVPGKSEGQVLPVLSTADGTLVLVDIAAGKVSAVPLGTGGNVLGEPQVLGKKVYIADRTSGSLIVYNTEQAKLEEQVKVTGVAGELETFVRDGLLWVNDEKNATAVVVDGDGKLHKVQKYDEKGGNPVPGDELPPTLPPSTPPADDQQRPNNPGNADVPPNPKDNDGDGDNDRGNDRGNDDPGRDKPTDRPTQGGGNTSTPDPGKDPKPQPTATITVTAPPVPTGSSTPSATTTPTASSTPSASASATKSPSASGTPTAPGGSATASPTQTTPTPKPPEQTAPGTPQAKSGAGFITVTFPKSSGATPQSYRIDGLKDGMKAEPASLGPKATSSFKVTGGQCKTEYSFTVTAVFADGVEKTSKPSTAVRPCTVPAAPKGLTSKPAAGGHGGTFTWTDVAGLTYSIDFQDKTTKSTTAKFAVSNLKNSHTYPITISATNEAGTSPKATGSLNLTPPKHTYKVGPNIDNNVTIGIRTGPSVAGTTRAGYIAADYTGNITVICQVKGEHQVRQGTNVTGSIWDKVEYSGPGDPGNGWTSDLYIRTPNSNSGSFSPEIWQCE
ncbi:hypothetical protein [Embleya sp. NPDC001921]